MFNVHNVTFSDITGTTGPIGNDTVAAMQCSGAAQCYGIDLTGINLMGSADGMNDTSYLCSNVGSVGFECTGNVTAASQALAT